MSPAVPKIVWLLGVVLVCSLSRTALADALVSVTLKDATGKPADGRVTLTDAEGQVVASCDAREGQCEMQNVAGGNYTVNVAPKQGAAPKPRKIMIPPSGKVALVVATAS